MSILQNYILRIREIANQLGNTSPEDAYNFRGRGFVQLTGRAHYQEYTDYFAAHELFATNGQTPDLISNPDLVATNPEIAAFILVHGMAQEAFANKTLEDYFLPNGEFDFYNAREIVNAGDDKSYGPIAQIAETYAGVLKLICQEGGLPGWDKM